MAVLLVAMSVMAVMMTVAMPVWRQAAQREREEELVFRGKQYAHAIGLFQRKYANAYPPNFDVLVTEKFLRKKFKDPITQDDFAPILVGQQGAGGQQPQNTGRGGASQPPGSTPGAAPQIGSGPGVGRGIAGPGGPGGGTTGGGIMGVTSKSKDKSIRLYNGRSHYNEWQFVYVPQVQAPGQGGAGAPGAGPGGQRGNSPNFPGGAGPIGGQRGGRGGPAGPGGGRGVGPGGQPNGPGRGGFGSPFQPNTPQQPISAPRGRG